MRARRLVASAVGALALVFGGATTVQAASPPLVTGVPAPQVRPPTVSLDTCSTQLYQQDARLGPANLPLLGEVGHQLYFWSRTGDFPQQRFLQVFWDPAFAGWRYPPQDGFVLRPDGSPVKAVTVLAPGSDVDRYGAEGGRYLAPAHTPYRERSIPPSSLVDSPAAGCDYHEYRILRPFAVYGGPIAGWFGQPGGGLQYQLDGTLIPGAPARVDVSWLLGHGFLYRER
ncbi:TNT domain-containing protein [Frankia sp. AgPm24]|uniref:TNT domain-containing protein n=1 Tax=Frankia sp. AgPm24 TaxID=631128 RepID=UPI00200BDF91|nr:TNT domain-containing protein [Frankia sp. AgPm24]MCK9920612.1 TNT domain-containing protein [Frankia sp. AgPm24]